MSAADRMTFWMVRWRWFRVAVVVFFWVSVAWLVYVLLSDDVPRGTAIGAVINPFVAGSAWLNLRQRTEVGAHGLRIVGPVSSRRVPWSEIAEVGTGRMRWGERYLEVTLTDGTTLHPPSVPASAAEHLEERRAAAAPTDRTT